jgi:hypothetical protein
LSRNAIAAKLASFSLPFQTGHPIMSSAQVDCPSREYDLYLTLFITSSGGW